MRILQDAPVFILKANSYFARVLGKIKINLIWNFSIVINKRARAMGPGEGQWARNVLRARIVREAVDSTSTIRLMPFRLAQIN